MAFALPAHLGLFRGRNGAAAGRGHQDTGQGAGLLPRTLRLLAANHRHRPFVHAGRHGAAAAADHRAVAAGRSLGDEPRGADAGRRAAHSHRVERQRRGLPRLLQRAGQKPLPVPPHAVRRLHAGRSGRGIHRRGLVRRGRPCGGFRRRGADPRRRVEERPQLFQRLPPLRPRGAVPAAHSDGHRARQGHQRRRHGGPHGAQNSDGGGRMARRTDGRNRRMARQRRPATP